MLNDTVLEVKHLGIGFQTEDHIEPVIHDIHFRIQRGETFALVGESGSGKSVTALSIMQLLPAAARVKNHSQIILESRKRGKKSRTCLYCTIRTKGNRRMDLIIYG